MFLNSHIESYSVHTFATSRLLRVTPFIRRSFVVDCNVVINETRSNEWKAAIFIRVFFIFLCWWCKLIGGQPGHFPLPSFDWPGNSIRMIMKYGGAFFGGDQMHSLGQGQRISHVYPAWVHTAP